MDSSARSGPPSCMESVPTTHARGGGGPLQAPPIHTPNTTRAHTQHNDHPPPPLPRTDTPPPHWPPKQKPTRLDLSVADFDVVRRLGEGSFSTVALARLRSDHSGRLFAVKMISKSLVLRHRAVEYVRNERNILDALDHPGIARLYFTFQVSFQKKGERGQQGGKNARGRGAMQVGEEGAAAGGARPQEQGGGMRRRASGNLRPPKTGATNTT